MTGRLMAPMRPDGTFEFVYTPSVSTNVGATIKEARARMDAQRKASDQVVTKIRIKGKTA